MGKQPYIPLYTGDYLKDTRSLPLSVRGAWVDLMIFMWDAKKRGVLINTMVEYAGLMSCTLEEANYVIGLLQEKGICDYEIMQNGIIKLVCRRMVRDDKISKKRAKAGKKGMESRYSEDPVCYNKTPNKSVTSTDNDIDNEVHLNNKEPEIILEAEVIGNTIEVPDKVKMFEEIFTDEIFIENLARQHPKKNLQEGFEQCWLYHTQKPSPPREAWEWRQKLSTWLINMKVNGTSKTTQSAVNARREGFARRHGSGAGN